MKFSVLVVTPTFGFGELIRQSLESTGQYEIAVFTAGETALDWAARQSCHLAILDADLEDLPLTSLVPELRRRLPSAHLIFIPPEDESVLLALDALHPDAYLTKPFYLPDLLEIVPRILGLTPVALPPAPVRPLVASQPSRKSPARPEVRPVPNNHGSSGPAPTWLSDVGLLSQAVAYLFQQTAARAVFVLKHDQMIAFAGHIPESSTRSLSAILAQDWAKGGGVDLARFVHLPDVPGDFLLYASPLGGEYLLAAVFEADKAFSLIRRQVAEIARQLRTPPPGLAGFTGQPWLTDPQTLTDHSEG